MNKLFVTLAILLIPVSAMGFGLPMGVPSTPVNPYEYRSAVDGAKEQADYCSALMAGIVALPTDTTNDPDGSSILDMHNVNKRNLARSACATAAEMLLELDRKMWVGGYEPNGPQTDPNAP